MNLKETLKQSLNHLKEDKVTLFSNLIVSFAVSYLSIQFFVNPEQLRRQIKSRPTVSKIKNVLKRK